MTIDLNLNKYCAMFFLAVHVPQTSLAIYIVAIYVALFKVEVMDIYFIKMNCLLTVVFVHFQLM